MEEFAKKHIQALLTVTAVLILTVISLSMFIGTSFRADSAAEESARVLTRARLSSSVDRLLQSLDRGSLMESYHFAKKASEDASAAGENEAAVIFSKAADHLLSGEEELARESLAAYLGGEIPEHDDTAGEPEKEEEYEAVSVYRAQAAEECVKRLFGENNTLRRETKCRNGELVFSCRNAYAVIDSRTGLPIEAAVSLSPAQIRLSTEECVGYAMRFLEDFFPPDIVSAAAVTEVRRDNTSGCCEVTVTAKNRRITMSVRRDTGRVSRLTAR